MQTEPLNLPLSAAQLNRLHEQALREATVLRDAAIDDFWRRVRATLRAGLSVAHRAAARLTHRLPSQQHRAGIGV